MAVNPLVLRSAALGALLGSLCCVQAAEQPAEPVQAIWKAQEFAFYFQSLTTFYSCDSLEAKLERILRELGVRSQVKVRSVDCSSGPVRMPRVTITASAPVEASATALAERDKDKGTRELIARVRGKSGEDTDALAQFPARWKTVSLSRGRFGLEPGDCELIEELRRKVLPKLAVRIVKDNVHCTPQQLTLGQPQLQVEALVEIPKPDAPASKR